MKEKVRYDKLCMLFNGLICVILCGFFAKNSNSSNAIFACGIILLILSGVLVFYARKNTAGFILGIYLFYSNYSIVIGVYFYKRIRPNSLYNLVSDPTFGIGIIALLTFTWILAIGLINVYHNKCIHFYNTEENEIISYLCFLIYLLIFFSNTTFREGQRTVTTAIGEYRYLFLMFGSIYARKTKRNKYICVLMVFVTSVVEICGGNRAGILPNIVIVLLLWMPNFSIKKIFPFILPAIILLKMVGIMRQDFQFSVQGIYNVLLQCGENKFVEDSFTFAYVPSLNSIDLSTTDLWPTKFFLLINNIFYIFAGGQYGKYTWASYTQRFYLNCGGYIAPTYFYYWAGYLGVILSALIVVGYIKRLLRPKNSLDECIGIVFISTVPRWYTYNFLILFRTTCFTIVFYYILRALNRAMTIKYVEI